MARTGRRPGNGGTREAILAAARESFAARGYDATTIRGVAAAARVDPALVRHYFGAKHELLAAALELPRGPAGAVEAAVAPGLEGLGERLVRTFLSVWGARGGAALTGLVRSASSHEPAGATLRGFVEREIAGRIVAVLDGPDARLRATLAVAQLVGLGMARHVVRVEPIASAAPDALVAAYGPGVQAVLEGRPPSRAGRR